MPSPARRERARVRTNLDNATLTFILSLQRRARRSIQIQKNLGLREKAYSCRTLDRGLNAKKT
jgi:hypothetical protein